MKKKIFYYTTIIALICIAFMAKNVEAKTAVPEPAAIYPITENVEFYNGNNERITTLYMNEGETATVTARIKFRYESAEQGDVTNIPVKYYVDTSSNDLELIADENGSGDGKYILGYNTDYKVVYDGNMHTDCYVNQTFQIKAKAKVSNASINFLADVNMEDSEFSDSFYRLPVFAINAEDLANYTVSGEDGNSILFEDESGKVFYFESFELTSITDEYMQEIADSSDGILTYEQIKTILKSILDNVKVAVEGKGILLKVFEFNLYNDGMEVHTAPNGFKIKIKITDDMKGYNSYKLFYINEDGTTGDAIVLTKNGDYLEGVLPHLSTYALIVDNDETSNADEDIVEVYEPTQNDEATEESASAENKSTISNSPKTGDSVALWISLVVISTCAVAGLFIYTRKK